MPSGIARICNDAWRAETRFHVNVLVKRSTRADEHGQPEADAWHALHCVTGPSAARARTEARIVGCLRHALAARRRTMNAEPVLASLGLSSAGEKQRPARHSLVDAGRPTHGANSPLFGLQFAPWRPRARDTVQAMPSTPFGLPALIGPGTAFHQNIGMKSRLRSPCVVANPRDAAGHRCGLRLA